MTQAQRKAAYGFAGPTAVAIREKVGQGLAIAALGGFRGLAANALMLQAHGAWEEQQWVRVRASLELATVFAAAGGGFLGHGFLAFGLECGGGGGAL